MTIEEILTYLRTERDRLDRAIRALTDDLPTALQPKKTKKTTKTAVAPTTATVNGETLWTRMRRIFAAHPRVLFTARSMLNRLIEDGWTTDSAKPHTVIGVELGRFAKKTGEISRVSSGRYRLRLRRGKLTNATTSAKPARKPRVNQKPTETYIREALRRANRPLNVPAVLDVLTRAGWRSNGNPPKGVMTALGAMVRAGVVAKSEGRPRSYRLLNNSAEEAHDA